MTKLSSIVQYLKSNGIGISTAKIANDLKVSKRHVRRAKLKLKRGEIQIPRILLLDIETLPMEVLVWGLYKQRIPPSNIIRDFSILCWCAKWLFEPNMMGEYVTGKEAMERDDSSIIKRIHSLIDEADVVVGQNLNRFDIRKLKARFILNDLLPTSPYQTIDTLTVARKQFSFSSYTLDELSKALGVSRKSHTEYKLWKDSALYGDEKSIKILYEYCQQDVRVLEDVYVKLRPYINSHPNTGAYVEASGKKICPTCGSKELEWVGYYYTTVNKYKSFRCQSCGSIGRYRLPEKGIKPELVSIAR